MTSSLFYRCHTHLSGHGPVDIRKTLKAMAARPEAAFEADVYGGGDIVQTLETRTCDLLGTDGALYFIKGMLAQYCLIRAVCEQRGRDVVALHNMSHIAFDESDGISHLHGPKLHIIGGDQPITVDDIRHLDPKPAIVITELPLRRAGYLLPAWDELQALSGYCRTKNIHLHVDGARLWEAAAGYGRSLSDVAALADSVYVSFYKGLGATAGAALCGPAALLDKVKIWQQRYGAQVYRQFPEVLSAFNGLDNNLLRMADWTQTARELAAGLQGLPKIRVYPATPHVNAFQIRFRKTPDVMTARHTAYAGATGRYLFGHFYDHPNGAMAEIVIGRAMDKHDAADAVRWISEFLKFID